MRRQTSKAKFWTILVMINMVAIMYPIRLCVQAEDVEAQILTGAILLSVLLVLLVTDTVSALVTYMQ
jgi:hypothetical protein